MAKQLDEFPGGGRGKYDWDTWFNGKPWELTAGEDFTVPLENFRATASATARGRGGKVRTKTTGEKTVVIQFYAPEAKAE